MLGKPAISKILHAGQELDNAVDTFAMKVVQTTKQSVIYCASTRVFCGYRTWRKNYCKRLWVGMEISCRLVFSCSSKVKINRLEELLEGKIRR